jgi:hypothetical protein
MDKHLQIEERVRRFQDLIAKGTYYRIMNWNLYVLRRSFWAGGGKFKKPDVWEVRNYREDAGFIC